MDDANFFEWMDDRLQNLDGPTLEISSDFLQQDIGHLLVDGNGACGITTACYLAGMGVTIFVFLEIMHNHGLVLQGGRARVTA